MAVITPNTDVILLKVPLEISDDHQLTFANANAQYTYFSGLTGKLTLDKFTYARKDGVLRVPYGYDDVISYNYVMYKNTSYGNKWFYAFITGAEYLNDGATALSIKTDVWQTYMFNLTYKASFVEREHTNDDTVGANTIPENFETGDYVVNGNVSEFGFNVSGYADWVYIVDVSMVENPGTNQTLTYSWLDPSTQSMPSMYVNNIPSGLYHLILGLNQSLPTNPRALIDIYDKAGLSDAIKNIYILPEALVGEYEYGLTISTTGSAPAASCGGIGVPKTSTGVFSLSTPATFARPTTINGYTPKNNKLLCYPWNYLNVSNNAGTTLPYRYEDWTGGTATFNVEGVLTPGGCVKAVPSQYKGIGAAQNSYDYSITGAKFPTCAWITDSYTNWLTQNAVNVKVDWTKQALSAGSQIITGFATGNPLGGLLGAGIGLAERNLENQRNESNANLVPDQAKGNLNCGDILWSKLQSEFSFYPMSIKAEYARCIDEYWSAFGYKTNRVKTPNITGRRNWNYVKTVGCYITADIPQEDLQEIKSLFDKGITFWHNPSTFMDYSQTNDIIS